MEMFLSPFKKMMPIIYMIGLFFSTPNLSMANDRSIEERLNDLQRQLENMQKLQEEVNALKQQLAEEKEERKADKSNLEEVVATKADDNKITIGGYGEITYANFKDSTAHPAKADLNRFVLFFGHQFSDQWSFKSELEIEHAIASKDDSGEVELEQAYLDYKYNDAVHMKAGLFLIPLGFLNENHEPTSYYGVFRNQIETRIIPTTWREGGLGFYGESDSGFTYDLGLTTGFNAGKIDDPAYGLRSGHQELQLATAEDLSLYGSLKYIGKPGLLLATGFFTGNTGQNGADNPLLRNVDAHLTLLETHARYAANNWDIQALYAQGWLGDSEKITAAISKAAPKSISGWYTQVAYHIWRSDEMDLTPFIRYERYDINQAEDFLKGFIADPTAKDRITTVGVNFKPQNDVVFKADYQHYQRDRGISSFNLGLGYQF